MIVWICIGFKLLDASGSCYFFSRFLFIKMAYKVNNKFSFQQKILWREQDNTERR